MIILFIMTEKKECQAIMTSKTNTHIHKCIKWSLSYRIPLFTCSLGATGLLDVKCLEQSSRHLEVRGTLWNTSRYPYLDTSDLQNWREKSNNHISQWICNLTPVDILKLLWKRGEIAPYEQFLLFSTIFCYLLLDFHVKTGKVFTLR